MGIKTKRVRIFAGPNGSGKSTFIENFPKSPNLTLGVYVNADEIEKAFLTSGYLKLSQFRIKLSIKLVKEHFKSSIFSPVKTNSPMLWKQFSIKNNKLYFNAVMNSYIAADLAEFIREILLKSNISFSFETVMSDQNKIEFMKNAKDFGYRVYLYYLCTENPEINKNRVLHRVEQNGHNVNEAKIESRYYRSLENLKQAVIQSNRAYIFDTSNVSKLICEIADGKKVSIIDTNDIPLWVRIYLFK